MSFKEIIIKDFQTVNRIRRRVSLLRHMYQVEKEPSELIIAALDDYLSVREKKQRFKSQKRHYTKILLKEQNKLCYYCARPLSWSTATIDHKQPLARNGAPHEKENLCVACAMCNTEKGALTEKEYQIVRNVELLYDLEE